VGDGCASPLPPSLLAQNVSVKGGVATEDEEGLASIEEAVSAHMSGNDLGVCPGVRWGRSPGVTLR